MPISDPEKRRKSLQQYSATHRPQRAIKKNANYARTRLAALAYLGSKCCQCGFADMRALQIDHVLGGGRASRRAGMTSWTTAQDVLVSPGKYQLLCANCNWIKRVERGEVK